MIKVTVMTLYPTADDRNTTYSFIQEGNILEYKQTVPENFGMIVKDERYVEGNHTYQMTGHLNYGWQPEIIITIKELVNNECLLSDIYKSEDGYFRIKILNKEDVNTELSNPKVRIKDMYIDTIDDDDGYDDYNVYEIEIIKGGE